MFEIKCMECGHGAHNDNCTMCELEGPKFWRSGSKHEFVPDWEDLQFSLIELEKLATKAYER